MAGLVARQSPSIESQAKLAAVLAVEGHDLRITRDLDMARDYLRERYAENPDARYGLVASSRDRDLIAFGVPNERLRQSQFNAPPV